MSLVEICYIICNDLTLNGAVKVCSSGKLSCFTLKLVLGSGAAERGGLVW